MGVPTSEVGYTPAMPRREDHEVHKGHVEALGEKKNTKRPRFALSLGLLLLTQVTIILMSDF